MVLDSMSLVLSRSQENCPCHHREVLSTLPHQRHWNITLLVFHPVSQTWLILRLCLLFWAGWCCCTSKGIRPLPDPTVVLIASSSACTPSGALPVPDHLFESCLRLQMLRWLWKIGLHFSENSISQKTEVKAQAEGKGTYQHGQSEQSVLFLCDACGRAEALCWIQAAASSLFWAVLSTPGLSGQDKKLHIRHLRVWLPGGGPSS